MTNRKKLLKMQELSEATGVASGTIRFYVQKGILPKPLKTHRNMAYYDESYIERIRTIKELQQKRYLPLNIIKMILESQDSEMNGEQRRILKEMDRSLFDDVEGESLSEPMDRETLIGHTGLSDEDIRGLEGMGIIRRGPEGLFDPECVRIAELVAEIRGVGLTEELDFKVEHLQIHHDLIEFLARKEIELFTKRVARKGMSAQEISTLARNAVNVLNKIIPLVHRRIIRRLTEEME